MNRSRKTSFLFTQNDARKFSGMRLDGKAIPEHKMSLDGLQTLFGIQDSEALREMRATRVPNVFFTELNDSAVLTAGTNESFSRTILHGKNQNFIFSGSGATAVSAWNSTSFGILVRGQGAIKLLRLLFNAITERDVLVYRDHPKNDLPGPLIIGIYSVMEEYHSRGFTENTVG